MMFYTIFTAFMLFMSQLYVAHGTTTKFNATFDTLPATPEEGRLNPVGTYLNISYTSFDVSQPAVAVAGLIPQSKPNYAFGVGSASSPAAMTIAFAGSEAKSFALTSLFYGCETNLAQSAASDPIACTITASGYKAGSSKAVAVQAFSFSPAKGLTAPMAFGTFSKAFKGLESVTYVQSPATGTEFILDNIVGTLSS